MDATSHAPGERPGYLWPAVVVALVGMISTVVSQVSIFLIPGILIAALVLPPRGARHRAAVVGLLTVGALCAVVGLVRFVVLFAVPGIVQGGKGDEVKVAVARLRELHKAEESLRQTAFWDPDRDGVGSAGRLAELTGLARMRGQKDVTTPFVHQRWRDLSSGTHGDIACAGAYCYVVYLPGPDGRGVAKLEDPVDDERAERRFVAYAWPATNTGGGPAVFLDEHEAILTTQNEGVDQRYLGIKHMPAFDAALPKSSMDAPSLTAVGPGMDRGLWAPWRGKKAREDLGGDAR